MESIKITGNTVLDSLQVPMDAYLETLGDFRSALAGFERLADLVLASDSPAPAPADETQSSFDGIFSPPPSVTFQPPSSPGGQSNASSVNCCASCTSNWPKSVTTLSSGSSLAFSSSSSIISSSQFSGLPDSNSGSLCTDSQSACLSENARGRSTPVESRRRNNATAAERYRRKLKGRRFGLEEELEQEMERNLRLRRILEAKLELYSEFADLLAQNTRGECDSELAHLGSRSLATILDTVWPAGEGYADARQRAQLEQLLAHFRLVQQQASATATPSGSIATLASESDRFECDYYDNRLVLAPRQTY